MLGNSLMLADHGWSLDHALRTTGLNDAKVDLDSTLLVDFKVSLMLNDE